MSRLGSVRVRPAPPQPLAFTQPTAIDLEPAGTLLLVENNPGRVLRVTPATGRVTVLVPSMSAPYAVVRAPSGSVFVSSGNLVQRLDAAGTPTTVAQADTDIGPLAVAANGDLYYATSTRVFRLAGGVGPPIHIAGTGVEGGGGDGGPAVAAQIEQPHGLAIAADGALLVDVRTDQQFDDAHVPGSVSNTMMRSGFGTKLADPASMLGGNHQVMPSVTHSTSTSEPRASSVSRAVSMSPRTAVSRPS